jgi:predicted patatin/cPLA2 family phospholipase
VIGLLQARAARGSRAPHGDGARIALAVEGGAMRGVVSAGMVSALEDLGLTHAFDAVYGSSAGALNAAYFLAGQARLGTTIYYEDINNRHFIDVRRPLIGRPIVDLRFLIDEVARRRKTLDAARVLSAPTPLVVMATDAATAARAPLRGFTDTTELFAALRAGATMPVVAGPPVACRGRLYLDASLTEPIPVPIAEEDGCTHILALLTRPDNTPRRATRLDRWYVLPRLRRLSPALAARYADRSGPYSALLDRISRGRGPLDRADVLAIRPAPPEVNKLERDGTRLLEAAHHGFDAVVEAFGKRPIRVGQR